MDTDMSTGDWFLATVCLLPMVVGGIVGLIVWIVQWRAAREG